jgi:hypothetical protein
MSGLNITAARAREIADAIDALDADIKVLQDSKRDAFGDVRAELEALGLDKANIRLEMAALKAAIAKRAKRREDADAVEERDALTDSYLDLIEGPAPRATHAIATSVPTREDRSKARTTEAMADNKLLSAELVQAGLISPEAHAENVAISDGVAAKYGNGPASEAAIPGLAEANAIAAAAFQPTAQRAPRPADTDLEIPSFLRRTTAGAHPSFGEQA